MDVEDTYILRIYMNGAGARSDIFTVNIACVINGYGARSR